MCVYYYYIIYIIRVWREREEMKKKKSKKRRYLTTGPWHIMCITAAIYIIYSVVRVGGWVAETVAATAAAEHAGRVHIHPRRMETNNTVRRRWALKKTNFIRTSRTYTHIIYVPCACARAHGDSVIRYGFVYIEPPAGRPRADGPPNRIW